MRSLGLDEDVSFLVGHFFLACLSRRKEVFDKRGIDDPGLSGETWG